MNDELTTQLKENDRHALAVQIMFDDKLYERTTSMAARLSKAEGMTPKHLIGKPEACFAVVTRALMWGLDPFSVAMSTYEVNGKTGFEGKLCHAILERSNKFDGRIKYELIGDWSKVQGKFTKEKAAEGKGYYAKPAWRDIDEEGLGVKIKAKLKDENEPIEFIFWLKQAHPRNSTLWATDPATQIKYLAIRRFANSVVPDVFMGVPFDREDFEPEIKDVTPQKNKRERKEANEINEILANQINNQNDTTSENGASDTEPAPEVAENKDGSTAKNDIEQRARDIKEQFEKCETLEQLEALRISKQNEVQLLPEALALQIHNACAGKFHTLTQPTFKI